MDGKLWVGSNDSLFIFFRNYVDLAANLDKWLRLFPQARLLQSDGSGEEHVCLMSDHLLYDGGDNGAPFHRVQR